jgi:hypothetical protein
LERRSLTGFRQANPLLLGDGGQDRQHRVPERSDASEVLFLEGPPIDPVPGEALKVLEGLQDALPSETVERPEQNEVELAFGGIPEQALELGTVRVLAGHVVNVLSGGRPPLRRLVGAELAEFPKLILGVLALVGRRHPGIDGNSEH